MSSVRPSVTLVDHDHIGWKSWKVIARTISHFALHSPKGMHLLLGNMVGWEKVACWSTNVAISLKRVKIEEKLLVWKAYRNLPMLFRMVSSPTPYGFLFPKIGGSQPPPKSLIDIITGMGKATDFKFCTRIHRIDRNKSPLKIS